MDDFQQGINRRSFDDSTSDYYVHQAFVQYLAPVGEGVEFTFGKFATPIGAEVADASKNWAVTRGNTYNLLQPIDHLGLMASTDIGPVTIGAGVVNQINLLTSSADVNSEKSYLGRIAIAPGDMFSFATTVAYGNESLAFTVTGDHEKSGLVDVLANFNSDAFSAYVNANYAWVEGHSPQAWGVSVAGMVPITDALSAGAAPRVRARQERFLPILSSRHSEIYGATGTLAYEIAENLTIKTEVRWDKVNENADGVHEFFSDEEYSPPDNNGTEDQVVGLAQVVYAF